MKGVWVKLDYYQNFRMKCSNNAVMLQRIVKRERIFGFLTSFIVEFDQVWVQIFGKETLPSLNGIFFDYSSWRKLTKCDAQSIEGSTMISSRLSDGTSKNVAEAPVKYTAAESFKANNQEHVWCTYCKKPCHARESCWKLPGKQQVVVCTNALEADNRG